MGRDSLTAFASSCDPAGGAPGVGEGAPFDEMAECDAPPIRVAQVLRQVPLGAASCNVVSRKS